MSAEPNNADRHDARDFTVGEALSPFKLDGWLKLTPGERLRRSWAMRSRLKNPREIHDRKLFPKA